MPVKQLLKDITTTRDGTSYDISRVIMTVNMLALIPLLYLGVGLYLYSYILSLNPANANLKLFDMQTFFDGVLTYIGSLGTLLTSGAASLWMKKSTEPNGETSEELSINSGQSPPPTPQNVTNVTEVKV